MKLKKSSSTWFGNCNGIFKVTACSSKPAETTAAARDNSSS